MYFIISVLTCGFNVLWDIYMCPESPLPVCCWWCSGGQVEYAWNQCTCSLFMTRLAVGTPCHISQRHPQQDLDKFHFVSMTDSECRLAQHATLLFWVSPHWTTLQYHSVAVLKIHCFLILTDDYWIIFMLLNFIVASLELLWHDVSMSIFSNSIYLNEKKGCLSLCSDKWQNNSVFVRRKAGSSSELSFPKKPRALVPLPILYACA